MLQRMMSVRWTSTIGLARLSDPAINNLTVLLAKEKDPERRSKAAEINYQQGFKYLTGNSGLPRNPQQRFVSAGGHNNRVSRLRDDGRGSENRAIGLLLKPFALVDLHNLIDERDPRKV